MGLCAYLLEHLQVESGDTDLLKKKKAHVFFETRKRAQQKQNPGEVPRVQLPLREFPTAWKISTFKNCAKTEVIYFVDDITEANAKTARKCRDFQSR
jgi:hypothetical protein